MDAVTEADPKTVGLEVVNGWAILPSSLRHQDSSPRFRLTFPAYYGNDAGARYLAATESGNGYELPTRNLIERTLRRGDLFIDVGAHWGLFTLQAATHPEGDIEVVSFEPELMNAVVLNQNIATNNVPGSVTTICAACGGRDGLAPLTTNSSMGHSVGGVGLPADAIRGAIKWVPIHTLDGALTQLQRDTARRVVLKIDAEGSEPGIIAGARSLLKSGRVALIIWEWGTAFVEGRERAAVQGMLAFLNECGFRHFQPPGHESDGPPIPLNEETAYLGNVFSFAPQFGRER